MHYMVRTTQASYFLFFYSKMELSLQCYLKYGIFESIYCTPPSLKSFCFQLHLVVFLFGFSSIVRSQSVGSLNGRVLDANNDNPIIGATVLLEGTNLATITDEMGYFQLNDVPVQTYNVEISYLGYQTQFLYNVIVKSVGNTPLLVSLDEQIEVLNQVVVNANPFRRSAETPLSSQTFSAVEIETYPGGNNDITSVVQSMPGISPTVGGFRNDLIIRGGAPNETVYYLDDIEIPNINHFSTQGSAGGPVGLINVSFINEVTLSTSAFGAQYDNALSGVLQFRQRDGNFEKLGGNLRIGASEAGITLEGPLIKDRKNQLENTTFLFSVRRSYLQFVFELIGLPIRPDYWDYQWKVKHQIDRYNTLSFIGIGSIDDFSLEPDDEFDAINQGVLEQAPIIEQQTTTVGLSWRKKDKSSNGFMLTTLSNNRLQNIFSRYRDNLNRIDPTFINDSKEQETKLRFRRVKFFGDWKVEFGFLLQHSVYENLSNIPYRGIDYESRFTLFKTGIHGSLSTALFKKRMTISLGIRYDTDSFSTHGVWSRYQPFSPRLAVSYLISNDGNTKFNASVGAYYKMPLYTILGYQEVYESLSDRNNSSTGYYNRHLPNDFIHYSRTFECSQGCFENVPASYTRSVHYVTGFEHSPNRATRISIEGFLKKYFQYPISDRDLISLANKGGDFEVVGNERVHFDGTGRTYGIEVLYQQKLYKGFYGILAYTYYFSKFSNKTDALSPSIWDNRHLISFNGGVKLKRNWELSWRWRFSGRTPYIPYNLEDSLKTYPELVIDSNNVGKESLGSFSIADIRIDKKWNFRRTSLGVYLEVQNFLVQTIPTPDRIGYDRDKTGELQSPLKLVPIDSSEDDETPIPSIGLVLYF